MRISTPRSLQLFARTIFFLGFVCFVCKLFCGYILHWGPPYNSTVEGTLGDLHAYAPIMPLLHQYGFLQQPSTGPLYMYPAPVALLYALFYGLPHKEWVMYALIFGTFGVGTIWLGCAMVRKGMSVATTFLFLGITLATAYPVWYESKAGNMEVLTFILVALAIWAFSKDWQVAAAVCIGIAGAMKLYPFVFVGLFIARRQYRAIVITCATAVALTIYSLAFITPSIAYSWHGIAHGITTYRVGIIEMVNRDTIGFDHSLFSVVKRAFLKSTESPNQIKLALKAYIVVLALGGTVLFFARIQKLPLLNQVILLTTTAVFLPPSSYDYTLMLLYVPWSMLVLYALDTGRQNVPGLNAILLCFAGLLAAEAEFIHRTAGFGGQIRALIFVATFALALRHPLRQEPSAERQLDTA